MTCLAANRRPARDDHDSFDPGVAAKTLGPEPGQGTRRERVAVPVLPPSCAIRVVPFGGRFCGGKVLLRRFGPSRQAAAAEGGAEQPAEAGTPDPVR